MRRYHIRIFRYFKIIAIVLLILLSMSALKVRAQSPAQSPINFNWSEVAYSVPFEQTWDGVPMILNYTGSYNDEYTYDNSYYNESGDTFIREEITITHSANYSHYSNSTRVGYIKMNTIIDIYKVDVTIGTVGRLLWMAMKNGSLEYDLYIQGEGYSIAYYEKYYQIINKKISKYNATTWELLDTWNEADNVFGEVNYSNAWPYEENPSRFQETSQFTTPIFLIMQMYTTENGDKIAWANLFNDFIFYEDLDNDGIYSVGDREDPPSSMPNIHTSDEYRGWMTPLAYHKYCKSETEFLNLSYSDFTPKDKSIKEIASGIQFTPPTTTTGTNISWGIQYPNFPIDASIIDHDKPMEEWWHTKPNASYSFTSPSTFSYLFDYNIDSTQADLDFTLEMPKLTNNSFYNAVQGYGLALPHYNYFLSSFNIEEENQRELTAPVNSFTFESNETIVAEINMMKKENYTLYDYPTISENTIIRAEGGSINPLMMGAAELSANSVNFFTNLIYGIRETVKTDPTFSTQDDLYRLQTQNYPVWNGKKFTHDPTLRIFYSDYRQPMDKTELIPGFSTSIIICTTVSITIIIILRSKKRKERIY